MKKFFLVALLVVSASIAFAQDKYEFMTINYQVASLIGVSIDGKDFSKEKVELPKETNSILNANPLLIKVKEYQDKGWELISFNTYSAGYLFYVAYLRKKKIN